MAVGGPGYASPESFQKFRHCNGHFRAFSTIFMANSVSFFCL